HPLGEYIYSDMKGYWGRADKMLEEPFTAREYVAFFPFGTTWLIAGIKYVFGRDNFTAVSIIYALFGASIVAMAYSIVDRVMGREVPWVAPATGLLLVVYYPLIAVGGYVLSELPFSLCLTLSLWLLIRLVEDGRGHHAWLLGLTLGVGTLIRSQMLLSVALVGAFWLAFRVVDRKRPERDPYAKLRWAHIGFIAVPLGLLLTMSA
ncbi:MAG: glycosyltransferase family 39 protein, partial [Myxococcales bacterium]|nr:glycosyltransferase family 39 protein [Myxococcales bacterium]